MSICREALFHFGTSEFVEQSRTVFGEKIKFTFRAAKGNVRNVNIIINENIINMKIEKSDNLFDYFFASVKSEEEILRYYFEITDSDETLFYDKSGAQNNASEQYYFEVTPGFDTPEWAKGAVMYQIFVERFCNGDKSNDVETNEYAYIGKGVTKTDDWYECPAADGTRQFYGGDLQGVLDKLDYLKKLGVEVIYLNPIFVSPSNHKYDTQDYDYIDPHFGKIVDDGGEVLKDGDIDNSHAGKFINRVANMANLEASNDFFARFTDEVHKKGMKVIIDGVFNHCGSFNKWIDRECIYAGRDGFCDGAFISKESPYNSYFKFRMDEWPYNTTYEGWWDYDTLPKLNYEDSDKLYNYILDIGRKWVSPPYNVDGWRLDVAADLGHSSETNHRFWTDFRKAVKDANPDAVILAEHYGDAREWLYGDQWDTVMNYDAFMEPVTWFLTGVDKHSDTKNADMIGNADQFVNSMTYFMARFQTPSLLTAMNELSNHDHSRFMTRTKKTTGRIHTAGSAAAGEGTDKAIMKEAVIMQMTWPGAPTIYYGDEAGLCGWTDPDNRRTYPWGREDMELLEFHRYIISIHKKNRALKTGAFKMLSWDYNMLSYGRFEGDNIIAVIVNNGTDEKEYSIPVWQLGVEDGQIMERLIVSHRDSYNVGKTDTKTDGGNIVVKMKGVSAAVFRLKR